MKLFLAGFENETWHPIIKTKRVENAFVSYYYMREQKDLGRSAMEVVRDSVKTIIVDSGAHSFFSERYDEGLSVSNLRKRTKTKQTPDEYMEGYLKWAKAFYPMFDYFVELDIGEIVTQKRVLEWREQIKAEGLYGKCITVNHPAVVPFEDWLATIKDSQSKYVAIEGERQNRERLPYNKLIEPCYKAGVRVHGFAMLKKDVLEKYPFYSVDSTSWMGGILYGRGMAINGKRNSFVNYNEKSHQSVSLAKHPIDVNELYSLNKKTQYFARGMLSVEAYRKMQKHYTALWELRGIKWV